MLSYAFAIIPPDATNGDDYGDSLQTRVNIGVDTTKLIELSFSKPQPEVIGAERSSPACILVPAT